MRQTEINPENAVCVLLSFEGPDRYSLAGGLGVRISNLARTLADGGYETHLFFVGDPNGMGEEVTQKGKLVLHRWCQWIGRYYPNGVYQGENEKLWDFNESIPWFVTEHIVKPAVAAGKVVAVLGEEWHTAEAMCRLSDRLYKDDLRDKVVMFWNANNTFGFDRINWKRLTFTTTITTVSRYMKHIMQRMGINPLVIPNGIPKSLLDEVDEREATGLAGRLNADVILTKVARWDPDKRWLEAVQATARLKARGIRAVLLARGGIEPYGEEILQSARLLGLKIEELRCSGNCVADYLQALQNPGQADILNLKFYCSTELLQIIYRASDAVLANSGHEPFGIVGLEAMASSGVAFTGCTGEDYAIHFYNAVVLETSDPKEIEDYVVYLEEHPEDKAKIQAAGKLTAARFTWEQAMKNLIEKLEYQARIQGTLVTPLPKEICGPVSRTPSVEQKSSRKAIRKVYLGN
ncbi:MAG: glycosyltransferase [Chloroflexi bacterium]|nr:glycosyltransferase [Chloroflexota bacterium]